jgi:hypothetical protein
MLRGPVPLLFGAPGTPGPFAGTRTTVAGHARGARRSWTVAQGRIRRLAQATFIALIAGVPIALASGGAHATIATLPPANFFAIAASGLEQQLPTCNNGTPGGTYPGDSGALPASVSCGNTKASVSGGNDPSVHALAEALTDDSQAGATAQLIYYFEISGPTGNSVGVTVAGDITVAGCVTATDGSGSCSSAELNVSPEIGNVLSDSSAGSFSQHLTLVTASRTA